MPIDDDEYDRDVVPPGDPPDAFDLANYANINIDELHDLMADPLPFVVDQGAAEEINEDNDEDNNENENDDENDDENENDDDGGDDDDAGADVEAMNLHKEEGAQNL
jgi:hypothetical protein